MNNLKSVKPQIIAFEGVDGCGKTTLIRAVQERLDQEGVRSQVVAMIPDGPVRDILLNSPEMIPQEQLLLLGLAHIESARQCREALSRGCWVLLDRTEMSRTVHQVLTDGLSVENRALNSIIGDCFPHIDHLCYLDIPFEVAQERLAGRGELDAIEGRGRAYLQAIYNNYQVALEEFTQREMHRMMSNQPYTFLHRVDALLEPGTMAAFVLYEINDLLGTEE